MAPLWSLAYLEKFDISDRDSLELPRSDDSTHCAFRDHTDGIHVDKRNRATASGHTEHPGSFLMLVLTSSSSMPTCLALLPLCTHYIGEILPLETFLNSANTDLKAS
uniref:Uncharacterized protein n=1 Tax=Mesocestoides corti TaxID=53468 RepID=A0A5K3G0U7_MESCO